MTALGTTIFDSVTEALSSVGVADTLTNRHDATVKLRDKWVGSWDDGSEVHKRIRRAFDVEISSLRQKIYSKR